jgi:hypothetical protein
MNFLLITQIALNKCLKVFRKTTTKTINEKCMLFVKYRTQSWFSHGMPHTFNRKNPIKNEIIFYFWAIENCDDVFSKRALSVILSY